MYSRRGAVLAGVAPFAVAACRAGDDPAVVEDRSGDPAGRREAPSVTFVSTPDLFNGDVGDLSSTPRWDDGANSLNDSWRRAVDTCLGAVARHRPRAVLVAGDLVEGRWNLDPTGRELFGPVGQTVDLATLAQCRSAITAAGDVYYGHYAEMFRSRGLQLLPALGDHEILDDRTLGDVNERWSPGGVVLRGKEEGRPDNRFHLVPHAKRTWADHFTLDAAGRPRYTDRPPGAAAGTAYAVDLGPMLRVVTVDVFHLHREGVRLGVFGPQLTWLRRTVRQAKRQGRVVVVQGHVPIIRPTRFHATGRLKVPEGVRSSFYRVMDAEGVDLYLCGEVHDATAQQPHRRGTVQVSHGAVFRYAFNYLVGQVYPDRTVALDLYEMTVLRASRERGLWCTDPEKAQRSVVEYDPVPRRRGRLVLRDRRVLQRTGKLGRYDQGDDPWAYRGRLAPEWV
ncbi:metallophosphoesterase family protein [Nocardioides litoris]|uniref:metallophosphoesterase family protein n=1 Tax=Nocardioides litoris TaxID=1926648 RepID=UPI001122CA21|nr:metallophosphoesterase [Nocardioides litoris]